MIKYPALAAASVAPVIILMNILEANPDVLTSDKPPYKGEILKLAQALANNGKFLAGRTFSENGLSANSFDDFYGDDEEGFGEDNNAVGTLDEVLDMKLNESLFTGESWETVLAQTEIIYSSLMRLRERVQKSNKADPNKVMNFYKNLGTLLEKIISLRERGTEAKEIHDFRNRVLAVLDNVLTPEQRTLAIQYMAELDEPLPAKQPEMLQIQTFPPDSA